MVTGPFGCTDHAQGCCERWCEECKSFLEVTPLRVAVIEAAKALLVDNLPLQLRIDRVTDAVTALLEVEKGAGR